jgi:hypothetical protein
MVEDLCFDTAGFRFDAFQNQYSSNAGVFINKIYCFLDLIFLMEHDVREAINDYW